MCILKIHFSPTENIVKKKTECDFNVWKKFFRNVAKTEKLKKPTDELFILICRFMVDIKKKDGGAYGTRPRAQFLPIATSRPVNSISIYPFSFKLRNNVSAKL